jgi:hypothetical protein
MIRACWSFLRMLSTLRLISANACGSFRTGEAIAVARKPSDSAIAS